MTGIIIKALSGFYYVSSSDKLYTCKARGSFRKNGISPLVGDRVEFEPVLDDTGVINEILPRSSCLARPPVANIQKLFIVSSLCDPSPNAYIIDKLTVIARHNNIEPIIVFNKCDLGDFHFWQKIYHNAGFKPFIISASKGTGIEQLKSELKGSVSAFTGNSGVGKSSILNSLLGDNIIPTGEVSQKLGRGRHTTRHTEIYHLPFGGFVADTPGFSYIDTDNTDYSLKETLADCFSDFAPFTKNCRFNTCSHTKEKGCAVIKAVNEGKIEPTRFESYIAFFEELKDLKEWEIKKRK